MATEPEFSIEDFVEKLISGEIKEDDLETVLGTMDIKKIDEARRKISVYNARPISGDGFLSFCLTNIRERYLKHLIMSTYVGFIHRMNDEYKESRVEENEIDKETADMEHKIIEQFLNKYHKFNPDYHVRRATLKDVQNWDKYGRDKLFTTTADLPQEAFFRFERYYEQNYEAHRMIVEDLWDDRSDIEYAIMPLRVHSEIGDGSESDKPDSYKKFVRTFEKDFPCDVHAVRMGEWTFTGPFQQNRQRIDFYTKDTAILQGMAEQSAKDKLTSKQLVEKRTKVQKAKSVKQVGPDAESFSKHRRENRPNAELLGVKHIDDLHEDENPADTILNEKGEIDSDDEDVPMDEVEIKVIKIGDGGRNVQKSKFRVMAENNENTQVGMFKPGIANVLGNE